MDESCLDGAEYSRKVASGRRVAGAIRSLINYRDLQIECARVLHETCLYLYGSKTMLWKKKERYRIRAIQIDNLRDLLGIRRMNRVLNTRIREFYGVMKEIDERIDEGVLNFSGGLSMWRG